jgi:hypothetical protein
MSDEINEIEEAARDAKRVRDAAAKTKPDSKGDNWPIAQVAIGVGVGSAAIAAAFLFANRGKK